MGVTDIAGVTDVAGITGGIVRHMAYRHMAYVVDFMLAPIGGSQMILYLGNGY